MTKHLQSSTSRSSRKYDQAKEASARWHLSNICWRSLFDCCYFCCDWSGVHVTVHTPVQRCYLQRRPEVQITSVQWHCSTPAPPTPTSVIIKPPTLSVSTCNILSLSLSLQIWGKSGRRDRVWSADRLHFIKYFRPNWDVIEGDLCKKWQVWVIKAVRFEGTWWIEIC